jgi:UDP-glucose 4-epimerase
MKVLVTGGTGFIGSHLTRRLVEIGNSVVVLDNLCQGNKLDPKIISKIELRVADIRDPDAVSQAARDCSQI